ncbi:hypothetical protein L596_021884 [Steinernema carpocapsae]|uniref:Chromo domain-containing protein n=1 Tax=Steinernema carpocapsae TaxID=34508 RepID=A0A4U5MK65_STECR|nr:hypothetical protein L596_021884 [Steinernema carpocapsae]
MGDCFRFRYPINNADDWKATRADQAAPHALIVRYIPSFLPTQHAKEMGTVALCYRQRQTEPISTFMCQRISKRIRDRTCVRLNFADPKYRADSSVARRDFNAMNSRKAVEAIQRPEGATENPGVPSYVQDIDEIFGERVINGKLFYLVRWKSSCEVGEPIRAQVPELVGHFELHQRIGRRIKIVSFRVVNPSENLDSAEEDVTKNMLFLIIYKRNQQTYVSYRFLELYYPKELILFMMPILVRPQQPIFEV